MLLAEEEMTSVTGLNLGNEIYLIGQVYSFDAKP